MPRSAVASKNMKMQTSRIHVVNASKPSRRFCVPCVRLRKRDTKCIARRRSKRRLCRRGQKAKNTCRTTVQSERLRYAARNCGRHEIEKRLICRHDIDEFWPRRASLARALRPPLRAIGLPVRLPVRLLRALRTEHLVVHPLDLGNRYVLSRPVICNREVPSQVSLHLSCMGSSI